jgi:hypothetical protein
MPDSSGIMRSQKTMSNGTASGPTSSLSAVRPSRTTVTSWPSSARPSAEATRGSSSTMRMRAECVVPPVAGAGGGGAGCTAGALSATGSPMVKVEPAPGLLSTVSVPPSWVTMPWQMDRPSPVPVPSGLVVKKGSKMRPRMCSGIPQPESLMDR